MKMLGRHLIVEFADCDGELLNNLSLLEEEMKQSVREAGATIVRSVFHRYNPHGVSGVIVIAESHFSIHTWPEYGYAALDFFTCGDAVDPYRAVEHMRTAVRAETVSIKEHQRGIPADTETVLAHKPRSSLNTVAVASP